MVLSFSPSHSELKALLLRRFWMRMLYGAAWLVLFPVPGCLLWHFLVLSGHWYCFGFSSWFCLLVFFWRFRCVSHEEDSLLSSNAPQVAAEISLHSHKKGLSPSPSKLLKRRRDSPSLVQCQACFSLRSKA